jgi:hypothetical protein
MDIDKRKRSGVTEMAVIEIRIIDMVVADRIDVGVLGGTKPVFIDAQEVAGAADKWVVLARATQSTPPVPNRASTPRQKMFSMDYAGWHERLAGRTRTA